MSQLREIIPGSAVTLHFSLSLLDGTPAISTFDAEPLSFYMGDKTFQPSMEIALYGLKAGDEQTLTLTTNQAYGEPDASLIQEMPLRDFTDAKPELDQIMTFSLPDGEETMGVIHEITDTHAMVDFNHPLAGHEVVFTVKILDVGLPDPTMIQDSIEN